MLRVYSGRTALDPCLSPKRVKTAFKYGWRDGRYHGYTGQVEAPTLSMVVLWDEDTTKRLYLSHAYSVGFFLGQIQDLPPVAFQTPGGPDGPDDAAMHDRIALVS